ncbi:hypothetical protein A8C75_06805 [Marinobacterium aestuarii]|uniref:Uncharacterized protein n=1 Tax=Marinobacterium aestuarii TaxID=1821621 RepID=A0A1A9EXH1_9GAMM|nr:hypothetical protein A8C75_06805 [Marinobacterium aestuarii]
MARAVILHSISGQGLFIGDNTQLRLPMSLRWPDLVPNINRAPTRDCKFIRVNGDILQSEAITEEDTERSYRLFPARIGIVHFLAI